MIHNQPSPKKKFMQKENQFIRSVCEEEKKLVSQGTASLNRYYKLK